MVEDMREVDFAIGERRRLVLAVQLIGGEEYRPEMSALRRIQNNQRELAALPRARLLASSAKHATP